MTFIPRSKEKISNNKTQEPEEGGARGPSISKQQIQLAFATRLIERTYY